MTFINSLSYLNLGIALTIPSANEPIVHTDIQYSPCYIEVPYSQKSFQLNITAYTIKQNFFVYPKRNFYHLYEDIAQSNWFAKSYKGKSLGKFIDIDY